MFEKPHPSAADSPLRSVPRSVSPESTAPAPSAQPTPEDASLFTLPPSAVTDCSTFAPAVRFSLHTLRHRIGCTAGDLLAAVEHLSLQPAWVKDQQSGHLLATVTLPEAEQLADLLTSADADFSERGHQPSTLNYQLKKPGRFYIIQLSPEENPLLVKLGYTTDLRQRLAKFRCIAPSARYFAHWPAEDFWERAATASVTLGSKHVGGEVYQARSLAELRERAELFLARMPVPAAKPRFIEAPHRPRPRFPVSETRLPHPLPHLLHLHHPQKARPNSNAAPPPTPTPSGPEPATLLTPTHTSAQSQTPRAFAAPSATFHLVPQIPPFLHLVIPKPIAPREATFPNTS